MYVDMVTEPWFSKWWKKMGWKNCSWGRLGCAWTEGIKASMCDFVSKRSLLIRLIRWCS